MSGAYKFIGASDKLRIGTVYILNADTVDSDGTIVAHLKHPNDQFAFWEQQYSSWEMFQRSWERVL